MRGDRAYLLHILEAARRVRDYTQDGQDTFFADPKTQDAVIRNIEIIGEVAKNLNAELKAAHADVPWKRIAGMVTPSSTATSA